MIKPKFKKSFLIGALAVFLAAVGVISYQKYGESEKSLVFSGVVQTEILQLSSTHMGKVSRRTFEEGGTITKGQELFKIDDEVLDAQKEYAKALLSQLEKEESLKKLIIEEVMEEYIEARRFQKPQEEIDKHVSSLQKAQASYDVVRSNLVSTQKQQNIFEAQVYQQTVRSPFDAVVHQSYHKEGDLIQVGQKVLSIYDPKTLRVTIQLDPLTFSQISIDHPAKLTFKEISGENEFIGKVKKVEKHSDLAFISMELTIDQEDANQVKPGMTAQVCFPPE